MAVSSTVLAECWRREVGGCGDSSVWGGCRAGSNRINIGSHKLFVFYATRPHNVKHWSSRIRTINCTSQAPPSKAGPLCVWEKLW